MILEIIGIFLVVCILFSFCLFPLFIAMGVNASHKILERNKHFTILEDKVDKFLEEKSDEEIIDKIYKMADKFEKNNYLN